MALGAIFLGWLIGKHCAAFGDKEDILAYRVVETLLCGCMFYGSESGWAWSERYDIYPVEHFLQASGLTANTRQFEVNLQKHL